jgi:hypothetical protein
VLSRSLLLRYPSSLADRLHLDGASRFCVDLACHELNPKDDAHHSRTVDSKNGREQFSVLRLASKVVYVLHQSQWPDDEGGN